MHGHHSCCAHLPTLPRGSSCNFLTMRIGDGDKMSFLRNRGCVEIAKRNNRGAFQNSWLPSPLKFKSCRVLPPGAKPAGAPRRKCSKHNHAKSTCCPRPSADGFKTGESPLRDSELVVLRPLGLNCSSVCSRTAFPPAENTRINKIFTRFPVAMRLRSACWRTLGCILPMPTQQRQLGIRCWG